MPDSASLEGVVFEFYKLALEQFQRKKAFERYAAPDFVEHSADIAGGTRQAAIAFLEGLIGKFPAPKWEALRSAAEGDLVFPPSLWRGQVLNVFPL
jgi:predicted SnoaL-like aldol condensation-catalyzing enzyme